MLLCLQKKHLQESEQQDVGTLHKMGYKQVWWDWLLQRAETLQRSIVLLLPSALKYLEAAVVLQVQQRSASSAHLACSWYHIISGRAAPAVPS
jgi:hypothetical protein